MDEPKRRTRRNPQADAPDYSVHAQEEVQEEAQKEAQEGVPHRRRRVQQADIPVSMPQGETERPLHSQREAQQNEKPTKKRKKPERKKAAELGACVMQALLGAAVLLSMTGAAIWKAAKRIKREHLRLAAMALCACVALVSAWQVGSIVLRSLRTKQLNESLSEQRAQIIAMQQEEQQAEPAQETQSLSDFAAEPAQQMQSAPVDEPEQTADAAQAPTQAPAETPAQADELGSAGIAAAAATAAPSIVKTTKYHQVGGDALEEMAQLHQQNHDLVAWIQIPDVLDLPVVYRDNSYYLTRDFSKQKNSSGTIFLDENHPFREKTQNLLLHGHNMKDGTMFGRLAQYLYDDTYLRNHPFIYFDTLWKKEQYVIFAVLDVSLKPSDSRFFNYFTHDTFSSDAEFAAYIRQLQLRSRYAIPIDVAPSDALLTLSTCLDDDRLVIVCRRLRENETRSDLRTFIRMATKQ